MQAYEILRLSTHVEQKLFEGATIRPKVFDAKGPLCCCIKLKAEHYVIENPKANTY